MRTFKIVFIVLSLVFMLAFNWYELTKIGGALDEFVGASQEELYTARRSK